ncbi:hypothetical protein sos41_32310 [Alphaproteobacteria bacterium SO-S41]|nr:hypothetical protein sos41_32310 [Alphaproteobacteria bacterium SO-S41]
MSMTSMATVAAAAIYLIGAASADEGWYATLSGGTDMPTGGDVQKDMSSSVLNLGTLNPALEGTGGSLTFNRTSWRDVYGDAPLVNFELGYNWSKALTGYARLGYVWDSSRSFLAGTADIPALGGAQDIYGKYSDYNSWLLTIGGRYTFNTESALKPYLGADIGAAFVKEIDATYTIPTAGIIVSDARLTDRTTAFTGGIEAGLLYDVAPNVQVGGSVGLRYVGGLDGGSTDLSGLGIAATPDAGHRLSVPLTISLSAKF